MSDTDPGSSRTSQRFEAILDVARSSGKLITADQAEIQEIKEEEKLGQELLNIGSMVEAKNSRKINEPRTFNCTLCNTRLQPTYKILDGSPINRGPLYHSSRWCTNCGSHSRHLLFPRLNRFFKFSYKEEPLGCLLIFMPEDVSSCIQAITA